MATTKQLSDLTCVIHHPSLPHRHTHTIIFLHGRGDTAPSFANSLSHSLSSSGQTLAQHFPTARFVFPSSALRPSARFPLDGVAVSQWFDTWDVANLAYREELQMPGLGESVAGVLRLAEHEVNGEGLLGGRWDRLVLAGLSQGGAVAIHALVNLKVVNFSMRERAGSDGDDGGSNTTSRRLGGVMGFSCRFPFPGRSLGKTREMVGVWDGTQEEDELIRNTPVLIEHCLDDPLVKVDTGREVRDTMRRFGAQVTWKEYPRGGHWLQSPDGIDDAVKWLEEHVLTEKEGLMGGK